jgi:hypothetical protein
MIAGKRDVDRLIRDEERGSRRMAWLLKFRRRDDLPETDRVELLQPRANASADLHANADPTSVRCSAHTGLLKM